MENSDGASGEYEMHAATPMITQRTPTLQPRDRVLDADSPLAMTAPCRIANDSTSAKAWDHEMALTSVAAISQDAAVIATERFDLGATVMDGIVAISWTTASDSEDA